MLAPWLRTDDGIEIARERATGEDREHPVNAFALVTMAGHSYWSLIVEGGPELFLREQDVVALERAFGVSRVELGGHRFRSAAPTPIEGVRELLTEARAPLLEAFAPRLVAAIEQALTVQSSSPLFSFLQSDAEHGAACAWLAQALFERRHDGATFWNGSAIDALRALLSPGSELSFELAPSDFGADGVVLNTRRGVLALALHLDGLGRASIFDGGGWDAIVFPQSAADLLIEVEQAVSAGERDAALSMLDRAAVLAPDDPAARLAIGEKLLSLDEAERALLHLDAALALPDVDPVAHFHRGSALAALGQIDEAIAAFSIAEEQLGGRARMLARGNCATLLADTGDREAALALLAQNTGEFPAHPEAWYALGLSLVKAGRYDESIDATRRALDFDPDLANGHYSIACAFALRGAAGDAERALQHVAEALSCDESLRSSIAEDEDLVSLRDDPRFQALLR